MEIDYFKKALKLSAVDFIEKPLDMDEVVEAAKKALEAVRKERKKETDWAQSREAREERLVNYLKIRKTDRNLVLDLCRQVNFPTADIYFCVLIRDEEKSDKMGKMLAEIHVDTAELRCALPRFGVHFSLPDRFRNVTYYGYGPRDSYADKKQSCYLSLFRADISDLFEDHIIPQENGSHDGCEYLSVGDGKRCFEVTADRSFSFQALEYTTKELTEKTHNTQLIKSGNTELTLDYRQNGIGSESCSTNLEKKYQFDERSFDISWDISIL